MESPEISTEKGAVERNRTVVSVAGREYTLTGTDSEEHMHRVADYVDRKMEELTLSTRLPSNMVSVLAAMNVADELLKSQDENLRLRKEAAALQQQITKLRAQGTGARPASKAKSAESKKAGEAPQSGGG